MDVSYTVTPKSAAGCFGTPYIVTVTINPRPIGSAPTPKPDQCSGVAFSFDPQNDITNLVTSTFTWTAAYTPGITGGSGTGTNTIAETLVNLTSSSKNAVYTVIPKSTAGNCTGPSFQITVPVNPAPVGTATITTAAQCSDFAFSFDPQVVSITNGVTSTFAWSAVYDGGSGQLTGGATTGIGSIAETLTNLSGTTRNAVYTVTPRSTGGLCFGVPFIITVPITSEPVGTATPKAAQCSGVAFNFNPQTSITNSVASNFSWTADYDGGSGNLTGGAGTGGNTIAETLVNVTGGTLTAIYHVTPTSQTGTCIGTPFDITVPVNPEPVGSAPVPKAAQCSGVAFSFNPQNDISNLVASTFTWTAAYDGGSGLLTGGAGSGTNAIAETLVNLTGSSKNAVYTVIPKSTGGLCTGASFQITVPVNPAPVGTATITTAAQCSDFAFSFDPQVVSITNGVTSTFAWSAVYDGGSGQLTGGAGSGTTLVAETLTNLSGTTRNAVYTVIPRSVGGLCFGASFIITVPITSEPVGTATPKAAQCSGVAFNFNPQTSITNGVASNFSWTADYDGGSGNLTGGAGTGGNTIAETLVNVTGGTLTAIYHVTPTSQTGTCIGTPFDITVPVNPEPVGSAPTPKPDQCSGVAFSFNPQNDISNLVASTFTWTAAYDGGSGLLTGGAGSGTNAIAETLVNLTSSSKNAVYTVIPKSTGGLCTGASFQITVPVNPAPVGTATITTAAQCSDFAFSFDPQVVSITNSVTSTFAWTAVYDGGSGQLTGGAGSGITLVAETLTNLSGTTRNAVYTVIPRSVGGLCFGASFTIVVPIRSEPVGTVTPKAAQCSNVAFNFNPQTSITNGVASNFSWTADYDGGSGNLTGGAGTGGNTIAETLINVTGGTLTAIYHVTPTSQTGTCIGTPFDITVPVNPEPVGSAPVPKAAQCSGVAFSFNPQDDITNLVASTFTWTAVYDASSGLLTGGAGSGTNAIAETLVNLTGSSKNAVYTVIPKSTGGLCTGASFQITVPVNPAPVGTATITTAAQCSDFAFSFDPQVVSITNGVTSTFSWSAVYDGGSGQLTGGAGSGTTLVAETLTNLSGTTRNAVYTVIPRSVGGLCFGASFTIVVPIRSEPVGVSAPKAAQCSNVPFNFNPQTSITNSVSSFFTWTADYDGGSGDLTGGAGSGGNTIAETLVNVTGGTLNAIYHVTPRSQVGNCFGTTFDITVPVISQPVGSALLPKGPVCSNIAFSFNPQNDITNLVTSTFTWTASYDGGSGDLTGGAGSGTGLIAEKLINLTGAQLNAVYTVTPFSAPGGCAGVPFNITVQIDPEPVGQLTPRPAQCSNVPFSVSPNGITNGLGATSSYTWVRNTLPTGLTLITPGLGNGMIEETIENLTNSAKTVSYTVTPTSASSCVGATYQVTVSINPEPVGSNITRAVQCSNAAFSVSAANVTNVASSYTWVRNTLPSGLTLITAGTSGATIAEKIENVTNGQLSAVYVVTPTSTAGLCEGSTYTVTVPINPQPLGSDITRADQCSDVPFSVSANNISNVTVGASSTFTWVRNTLPSGLTEVTAGSGSGPIAETLQNLSGVQKLATYVVTPKSADNCTGATYVVTVPVNPEPVGAPTTTITRCSGAPINFDLSTLISPVLASNFKYTLVADFPLDLSPSVFPGTFDRSVASNALISETFSNYSNHDVTLTYTVTPISAAGGCAGDPFTFKVVYYPEPVGSNLTDNNCNTTLSHNIQTQITSGLPSVFTYVVTSSDEVAVPTPPALDRTVASNAIISDSYVNLSGALVTVTYTITAYNAAHTTCAGAATFTYNVAISPKPVGVPSPIANVCSDVPYSVDPQNYIIPAVPSTFVWSETYDGTLIRTAQTGVINATFNNTSNVTKNVVYTITPTSTGTLCPGLPFDLTVPINPEPVMDPALATPGAVCSTNIASSNPINVILNTNGSSVKADSYVITLKSQDPGLVGTPTVGTVAATPAGISTAIQNDKYSNTTSGQLIVVYTIVPKSAAGCSGDAFDITVKINPEPVLATPGFPAVCSTNGPNVNIVNVVLGTNGTSAVAATYKMVNRTYSTTGSAGPFAAALPAGFSLAGDNNAIGATGTSNLVRNEKFNNVRSGVVTVRFTVTATTATTPACTSLPLDYDVDINPEPILDPLISPTPVCSGVVTGITMGVKAGSVAAARYNLNSVTWPITTGFSASATNVVPGVNKLANAIFNDSYVNTTNPPIAVIVTYHISPVSGPGDGTCIGPEGTITVQINPAPEIADGLDRIVCSNASTGVVFTHKPGTETAVTFNVVSIVADPALVPNGANVAPASSVGASYIANDKFVNPTNGPLNVTYKVSGNSGVPCLGPTKDIVVRVEPTVIADKINHKLSVCSGSASTTDLTDIELISPTVPTAGGITFSYSAAVTTGSGVSGFTLVTLSNLPANHHITDNLVNTSNSTAVVTYTITAVANGAASGSGCSSVPITVPVTVEPKPKLIATPPARTICEGPVVNTNIALSTPTTPSAGTIEYLLVSAVPTGGVTGMSPNGTVFPAVSTLADVLSSNSASTETVTYTLRPRINGGSGCIGDDVVVVINVNARPDVVATPIDPICSNSSINIPLTANPAIPGSFFSWTATTTGNIAGASGGTGTSIIQNLVNTGTVNAKVETVTYTITGQANGCAGTPLSFFVKVNPSPRVTSVSATPVVVCHGTSLNVPLVSSLDPAVLVANPAAIRYTWTVSSNNIGVPTSGGSASGASAVINQLLTNTTGITENLTYEIVPFYVPAGFPGPGIGPECEGEHKILTVRVSPQITAQITNAIQPAYLCKGTTQGIDISLGGVPPFEFKYTKTTKFGTSAPITVAGVFNFTSIFDAPNDTTTYTITSVKDGLGCTTPFNVAMTVYVGDTDNNFSIISPIASCHPNVVSFQYNQVMGTIYNWHFGDMDSLTAPAPMSVPNMVIKHTYNNLSPTQTRIFSVRLETSLPPDYLFGCAKSSAIKTITVYPNIIPNVISDKTEICSGEAIQFLNQSVGATSQAWTYRVQGQVAETAMGTGVNINFVFNNPSTDNPIIYEVIFRATNGFCPIPDQVLPIKVYRSIDANFDPGTVPPFVNGKSEVTFTNTSTPVDGTAFNYDWNFGSDAQPASFSGTTPPTIKYVRPGPKTITLSTVNKLTPFCKSTITKTIDISLLPLVATFTASPVESCFPSSIAITQSNITGDEIDWRVIDPNGRTVATSTGVSPVFKIPSPGKFTITLKTSSSLTGQTAVATPQDITVYPKPRASFLARPELYLFRYTELSTANYSTGANQYYWDFDFNGESSTLKSLNTCIKSKVFTISRCLPSLITVTTSFVRIP